MVVVVVAEVVDPAPGGDGHFPEAEGEGEDAATDSLRQAHPTRSNARARRGPLSASSAATLVITHPSAPWEIISNSVSRIFPML